MKLLIGLRRLLFPGFCFLEPIFKYTLAHGISHGQDIYSMGYDPMFWYSGSFSPPGCLEAQKQITVLTFQFLFYTLHR